MLLTDRTWKRKYTREDGDLVRKFYVPALSTAVRYDRITGYFTAEGLALAAAGIEYLALNEGAMRLIVGCTLNEAEVHAIEAGLAMRDLLSDKIGQALPATVEGDDRQALELLAWLVCHRLLDIRVAIRCTPVTRRPIGGTVIFHEKCGIIEDKTGDRLAFTGSLNETFQGWRLNGESISVFTSWGPAADYVNDEDAAFNRYWSDKADSVMVVDVPTAVRDALLKFLPPDDEAPERMRRAARPGNEVAVDDGQPEEASASEEPIPVEDSPAERRAEVWERMAAAANDPAGGVWVGEATSPVEAWPHQRKAFLRMYGEAPDHAARLLVADEVGLGKTIQAGLLIRQSWLAGRMRRAIILAPANVCAQWQAELREKFALNWPLYDGQCMHRYDPASQSTIATPVGRLAWAQEPFVIMSSHLARRRDRRPELLTAEEYDLVVVDEAHHARVSRTGRKAEPNMLMRLLRDLRTRTRGLVLLTATPLQTNALELYDLLALLGLPDEWTPDEFERYFEALREPLVPTSAFESCVRLFQATEGAYGALPETRAAAMGAGGSRPPLSRVAVRTVLAALRGESSIRRRRLSPDDRRAAIRIMLGWTPISALVSRHTRALLRRYRAEGKLDARIATRLVADRFIDMSNDERDLYEATEKLITDAYANADEKKRAAIGFVLTIYRKRLSSSFTALSCSLRGRLERAKDMDDDLIGLEDEGQEVDADEAAESDQQARELLETAAIQDLLARIALLPPDSKAVALAGELRSLEADGYKQTMVFTGYTDTMDSLRDWLARETGREVICFSGRGGEVRGTDGRWRPVSRADIKRRFRKGDGDILLCTDAAAEGLNFQFCGSLINYDMPWNPMRVEQRIGRVDRLGQQFDEIRIVNLHYADTIETQVYQALSSRIRLFETLVGGLQPILSSVSKRIAELALSGAHVDIDAMIASEINQPPPSVDLDDEEAALEDMPMMGKPALDLADLARIIDDPILLPPGYQAAWLSTHEWTVTTDALQKPVRVTLDRDFYGKNFDSAEFWTPGSPAFPCIEPMQTPVTAVRPA
ncbi:helicase-related protein [Phenylobacterium sp.]|uniref:SNF2-related protein n=1 Tax=Phenylobacterium sp. TaxID=1871053 RepID=UPI00260472CF|nr:helicase-related protein [Phenylobacterium sp.]